LHRGSGNNEPGNGVKDIFPRRGEPLADRPMRWRVVHVVRQFWPSIGGLEEVVLKLSLK
jgi:hypothetical protein